MTPRAGQNAWSAWVPWQRLARRVPYFHASWGDRAGLASPVQHQCESTGMIVTLIDMSVPPKPARRQDQACQIDGHGHHGVQTVIPVEPRVGDEIVGGLSAGRYHSEGTYPSVNPPYTAASCISRAESSGYDKQSVTSQPRRRRHDQPDVARVNYQQNIARMADTISNSRPVICIAIIEPHLVLRVGVDARLRLLTTISIYSVCPTALGLARQSPSWSKGTKTVWRKADGGVPYFE